MLQQQSRACNMLLNKMLFILTKPGKRFQRSLSLRGTKKGDRSTSLQRAASLRPGQEKSAALIKDINLKTSSAHRDKDKGS